jgi:hypothetical protein
MECKKEENKLNCNCSFECAKKGICCECIAYHRENDELPACYFNSETEKLGDRSLETWAKSKGYVKA